MEKIKTFGTIFATKKPLFSGWLAGYNH